MKREGRGTGESKALVQEDAGGTGEHKRVGEAPKSRTQEEEGKDD